MTAAQYVDLQETLHTILNNQKAIYQQLELFQKLVEGKFEVVDTKFQLDRSMTQVADSHIEVVREEVRIIKSLIAQQVLPRLGAEFPEGYIPLEWPGREGLPEQKS